MKRSIVQTSLKSGKGPVTLESLCCPTQGKALHQQGTYALPGRIAHPQGLSFVFPGVSPLVVAWYHSVRLSLPISWLLLRFQCFRINLFTQSSKSLASEWDVYHSPAFFQDFPPADLVIVFLLIGISRERVSNKMEKESHWNLCIPGSISYLKRKARGQQDVEDKWREPSQSVTSALETPLRVALAQYKPLDSPPIFSQVFCL